MDSAHQSPEKSRRNFLFKYFRWTLGLTSAALVYPLLRFSGYAVKPKPRHIVINKNIPVGSEYTDHEFILFVRENGPVAVSRKCTHLGCRVSYRKELQIIECPCHQSRFTPDGVRVSGPAENNLAVFPVKRMEDERGETTGYTVTL